MTGYRMKSQFCESWKMNYLNRLHVKLISLDNPDLTFKPAMERGIMPFVQRQTSSQENKSKSPRSYSGGRRNIELGYLNTNTPPFGYVRAAKSLTSGEVKILREGETIQKRFEKPFLSVSETEAEIIRRIFKLRASGSSIRRIAQVLNEDSIPSPKGKLWRKNVLNRMIANPVYYGAVCWGKTTSSRIMAYENGVRVPSNIQKFSRPTEKAQWTINENAGLPPIVSKELWVKANSVCLVEQKPKGRSLTSRYLLSGILFDSESGSAMVGSDGCHYRRKDGSIYKKRYYNNNNWHSQGIDRGIRSLDAASLEQKIVGAIKDNLLDGKIVEKLERMISSYLRTRRTDSTTKKQIHELEKQLAEKEQAISNLVRAIQLAVDVEPLVTSLKRVEREKQDLMARKVAVHRSNESTPTFPSQKELGKMAAAFLLRFEKIFMDSPMEERREFVQQWIEKIELLQHEGRRKARVLMRLIPKAHEFDTLYNQLVLSGPWRT